jgi:Flp pilus assembly protein TadD
MSRSRSPRTTPSRPRPTPSPANVPAAPDLARRGGRRDWLLAGLLATATLVAYAPALSCGFVNYDDDDYVTQNPQVRAGLTGRGAAWAWTTSHSANWHPLTWLSLMADTQLHGTGPWGYHFANVVLHTANTLLLFALLRRLTGDAWPSALVAGLFALHPLHVESVAWVTERKDVLSTLFGLLALLAYARYARSPGVGQYLLVVVAFALSLLAKPMLVTLPCLMLLLDYWPLARWPFAPARGPDAAGASAARTTAGRLVLEKVPLLALSAASSVMTVWAQQRGRAVASLETIPLPARLTNALLSVVEYLRQTILPLGLAPYYPVQGAWPGVGMLAGSAAVLAGVTALVLWYGRRRPYLPVGWLWFLGTLVPVIGLVHVGTQARADRYTYFPLVGVFILAAWALAQLARRRHWHRPATVLCGLVLLGLGVASWAQAHYWKDSLTLWEHALAATGDNVEAHNHLGCALMDDRKDLAGALRHFQEAIRLHPGYPRTHNNLGLVMAAAGEWPQAGRHFGDAVALEPGDAKMQSNLAVALLNTGDYSGAIAHSKEALRLDPYQASVHFNLGTAYEALGQWAEAAVCFHCAQELAPGTAAYHRELALCMSMLGLARDARTEYQKSLRADPHWPETLLPLAWTLAVHPDPRRRNGPQALRLARQLVQAGGDRDPRVLDTLAAAYAENRQFSQAVDAARAALALATSAGQTQLTRNIEERLRLYQNKEPFRATGL